MTGAAGRPGLPGAARALHGTPRSAAESPRNALAAQVRRITALTVGRPIGDADYREAADRLRAVADDLEQAAGPGKAPRGIPVASGHPQDLFATSPVIGYANPIAPPVDVWAERADDGSIELRGRGWFDYQYEGPPTCVHGGVIASVFDELLGAINIVTGQGGFTGTLTVVYRRTTPLHADLELRARHTGREGRKIFAWGGIYHRGELTAEADGIFIEVRQHQMAGIVGGNARSADGAVVDEDWAELVAADTATAPGPSAGGAA